MKRVIIVVLLLLPASTIVQAAGLPLPLPDPEMGTIGVTIRGKYPIGTRTPAVQVYFVRVDEGVDKYSSENVIRSNFSKKKQVYLLNCEPGRYAAVGAQLASTSNYYSDSKVFFGMEMISETEVTVEAGEIAFMGDLLVDLDIKMNGADEAQSHYFRLVDPDSSRKSRVKRSLTSKYMYRGELIDAKRTSETEASFWNVAGRKVFKKYPAWAAKVARP